MQQHQSSASFSTQGLGGSFSSLTARMSAASSLFCPPSSPSPRRLVPRHYGTVHLPMLRRLALHRLCHLKIPHPRAAGAGTKLCLPRQAEWICRWAASETPWCLAAGAPSLYPRIPQLPNDPRPRREDSRSCIQFRSAAIRRKSKLSDPWIRWERRF